jgi:hypothetical protein
MKVEKEMSLQSPNPDPSESRGGIDEQLAALGLTRGPFVKAAKEHLAAYFSCSEHYPVTFPPTFAWAAGNRSLRDDLVPTAWNAVNERNQPLVINEDETIAITALSGDERTGTEETPSTRSPKGRTTAEAVQTNSDQFVFEFMEDAAAIAEAAKVPGRSLWIFLIHRDHKKGELRSELSCPCEMGDDGYIEKWHDRIIFPPISFDTEDNDTENPNNPNTGNDNGGQTPEITVQIRKLG